MNHIKIKIWLVLIILVLFLLPIAIEQIDFNREHKDIEYKNVNRGEFREITNNGVRYLYEVKTQKYFQLVEIDFEGELLND